MKYYKGFPEEIKIGEGGMTLHDVERLMLSLYWDEKLNDRDKNFLMDLYKEERMHHLDEAFACTADELRKLKDVESIYLEAVQRMEATKARMAERELQKMKQGLLAASNIYLYLEIGELEETGGQCYSDEELDLWSVLCGEDRRHNWFWGVNRCSANIKNYEEAEARRQKLLEQSASQKKVADKVPQSGTESLDKDFLHMKKKYCLAWTDMMRITRFDLTVKLSY